MTDQEQLSSIAWALLHLLRKVETLMSAEQSDVDALTSDLTQIDTDEKANAAAIAAGQQALDTIIANLKAGQAPDLTALLAAKAVLDGDHPTLEAAVTALTGDPNAASSSTPASSGTAPSGS